MNTSRVPGVTRNSGWQAVTGGIDQTRAGRQEQDEVTPTEADPPAAGPTCPTPAAPGAPSTGCLPEQGGR